jgi:hypothetical protein
MGIKRLKESLAIVLIGDGAVAFLDPDRHNRLWKKGPQPYQKVMREFVQRPGLTRLLSVLEIALGLWLASRQKAR